MGEPSNDDVPGSACCHSDIAPSATSRILVAGEILGLDPLYVANEGKLLAITAASEVERVLAAMQSHPLGREAAIIGEVTDNDPGFVMMKTRVGGKRVVDMLSGEQLPRIC